MHETVRLNSTAHISEVDGLEDGGQVSGIVHSRHQYVVAVILAGLSETRHGQSAQRANGRPGYT